MVDFAKTTNNVRNYYGKVLKDTTDLKASACCPAGPPSSRIQAILNEIEPEIKERFYGCGSPLPPLLDGCRVLDLGCGTGRDVYVASKLVGSEGHVIGVDMTEEQLEVGRRYLNTQTKRFGFSKPNVSFKSGFIEDLETLGVENDSVDVVTSNCAINLSPDKRRVFSEIYRVLKPGGELNFSDVFADRRIPASLQEDPILYGECLAGALYVEDFRRLMRDVGFPDHRVVSCRTIPLNDPKIRAKAGMITFFSITTRAFKLDTLEDRCEDYGQVAFYKGTIPGHPHVFHLDDHHALQKDKPMLVCGNTAAMLEETRYAPHFRITGDRTVHHGLFDCNPPDGQGCNPSDRCC